MFQSFPERCLRGLRDKECISRDHNNSTVWILGKAFEPSWKTSEDRVSKRGKSNHYESSINWEDEPTEPFRLLCEDKNNAKYGIVSVRLADLKRVKQLNSLADSSLDWERDKKKGNPFHGNLLFSGNLTRPVARELAAVIATCVQDKLIFIEPENYDSELSTRTSSISSWRRALARVRALVRL